MVELALLQVVGEGPPVAVLLGAADHRTQKAVVELVARYADWSRPAELERWRAQLVGTKE